LFSDAGPNKLAKITALLIRILAMPGSNLGRNTDYLSSGFGAYPDFLQQVP
jgi:hypothetical protein